MSGIASLSNTARDMFRGPRGVASFIPHLKDGGEATYRSPLFGRRVDRYIPPEVRQVLGAAVAGADMLNPVSAYREYLKEVDEGDYTDAAVEAAGILAPGVAGKLVKPAVRAAGPYVDDATKAMMEMFLPTGAPDVAPRMAAGDLPSEVPEKKLTFDELRERARARIAEKNELLSALTVDDKPVRFKSGDLTALVSRSPDREGWRVTYFQPDGSPSGHSDAPDKARAVWRALDDQFLPLQDPRSAVRDPDLDRGIGSVEPASNIPVREGIRAYHGSPHKFERFDMSKVGTGEGAQSYGHGLYFAELEDVARGFRDRISLNKNQFDIVDRRTGDSIPEGTPGYKAVKDFLDAYAYDLKSGDISHKKKWWAYQIPLAEKRLKEYEDYAALTGDFEMFKDDIARMKAEIADYMAAPELVDRVRAAPRGSMYEVMIDANPEDFLDWDKPFESADELERFAARFDAIDPVLRKRIEDYGYLRQQMGQPLPDGNDIIREIMGGIGGANAVRATEVMREAGIPGIKYLDAGSRGVGEGTRNYVVFDDRLINIVRVYGVGGAAALLGVSAVDVEQALADNLSESELRGLTRPD